MSQAEVIKKSLVEITEKHNLQGDIVKGLQETVKKLEERLIALQFTSSNTVNGGKELGFTDLESAKSFIGFVNKVMFTPEALKAANTVTDSEGGFLVLDEFSTTLIRLIEVYGVMRRGATIIPMTGDTLNLTSLLSGVTTYWVDQGAAITESQPAYGRPFLVNKKLAALVGITGEMEDDSAIPLANLIAMLSAEAMAAEEDRVGFMGDISGSGDPFNGILYDANVAQITMAPGDTTFSDITADYLLDMQTVVKRSVISGAKYYIHRTVHSVTRKLKDDNGNYIYEQPAGTQPGTLWSYPYELIDTMPALTDTAVDTPYVAFGNLKHMFMGDRKKMTMAKTNAFKFNLDITHLRFIERIGFLVGQPEGFSVLRTAAV